MSFEHPSSEKYIAWLMMRREELIRALNELDAQLRLHHVEPTLYPWPKGRRINLTTVYKVQEDVETGERAESKNQGRRARVQPTGDKFSEQRGTSNPIFIGFDGCAYRQTSMDEYDDGVGAG